MSKKLWIIIISIILVILSALGFFWFRMMTARVLYGAPLFRPKR